MFLVQLSRDDDQSCLTFRGERVIWYRPVDLSELLDLKYKYPDAPLVCGHTRMGNK